VSADDRNAGMEETPERDLMMASLEEQAEAQIRRVWHEGRWFFSVIDVIGLLTDSTRPRTYWTDMKSRFQDDEGFTELCEQCHQAKMIARDGKLRETDCADFTTMTALIQYLPMQYRRQPVISSTGNDLCGVYTILNTMTQDQYIGSSMNIAKRFVQHRSLLRRGKHYADRLQDAWNEYGEDVFSMTVLEEVADPGNLAAVEQRHLDQRQPAYNNSKAANNLASSNPIPPSRIQRALGMLYKANGGSEEGFLFRAVQAALAYGVLSPGPRFAILLQADAGGVSRWDDFDLYLGQLS
jgi:hypothetical protein